MQHPLDPSPREHFTDAPGIGGVIKLRAEDFLVDEVPAYPPTGEGEHIYLGIEKRNTSHGELMSALTRFFDVESNAIGFAGMKDKVGITRQTVSIHLHHDPPNLNLDHDRIRVLWASRHRNKIRRGHLIGNRFAIRIREVDPLKVISARRTLEELQRRGVPNYFGPQRFGYRRNNHLLGAMMLTGRWQEVLDELLGTRGTPFPDHQRERREKYEAGEYEVSEAMWSSSDHAEKRALQTLIQRRSAKQAVLSIGRTTRAFWVNAMQSALFNRVLDERLRDVLLCRLIVGDLAWKHQGRAVFPVTAEELESGELDDRIASFEVSPSGPLWGRDMIQPAGEVLQREQRVVEDYGWELGSLIDTPHAPGGGRRPLRVPLTNAEIDAGTDEHGGYIRVAFDLPRGSYATVALREVMKGGVETLEGSRPDRVMAWVDEEDME